MHPQDREPAVEPEDLGRLFLQRARAGDVDGVIALYETDAVVTGDIQPALRHGDLALTSTRFRGGATAEIARRRGDGSWLWIADQPNVVR